MAVVNLGHTLSKIIRCAAAVGCKRSAQSQLFQTKRDLAQARYNVLLGGLRLRQANGTLSPADLLAINALLVK